MKAKDSNVPNRDAECADPTMAPSTSTSSSASSSSIHHAVQAMIKANPSILDAVGDQLGATAAEG